MPATYRGREAQADEGQWPGLFAVAPLPERAYTYPTCPTCNALGGMDYCWTSDTSLDWFTEHVHRARAVAAGVLQESPTCPCAGRCTGCQCPCSDCTAVRDRRAAELQIRCTRCSEARPESDFSMRSNGRRQSWCRQCTAAHNRARRATRQRNGATTARGANSGSSAGLERTFGVEIECLYRGDQESMAEALREHGLDVEARGYTHDITTGWKIVDDASVSRGYELVSPILSGVAGRAEVRRMMAALVEVGATVNRSCGLHVHHDVTELSGAAFYRLAQIWSAEQSLIDGLVAPSRRGSRDYTSPLDEYDLATAERLFREAGDSPIGEVSTARSILAGNRYRSLNWQSFGLYGTVEIRQHQGTLNGTKALAWIMFGQAMIARAVAEAGSATARPSVSIEALANSLERHGLEPTTTAYLVNRYQRLNQIPVAA